MARQHSARWWRHRGALVALAALATGVVTVAPAAADDEGFLDASFALNGRQLDWTVGLGGATAIAVQPDRKIVAAINDYNHNFLRIVRYAADGSIDEKFGNSEPGSTDYTLKGTLNDILVQSDGKILAAGMVNVSGGKDVIVVRLLPTGFPDSTFGTDGVATGHIPGSLIAVGYGVALQPTGVAGQQPKIVVSGFVNGDTFANPDPFVMRFTAKGAVDSTFGGGGYWHGNVSTDEAARNLLVLPSRKIVTVGFAKDDAGSGNRQICLFRLTASGALDTTFGDVGTTPGARLTDVGSGDDDGFDIVRQPDGKLVIAGSATWANLDLIVARYTAGGALDTTFGPAAPGVPAGVTNLDIGFGAEQGFGIALQRDGKIVAVGTAFDGAHSDGLVARLTTNGDLDSQFNPASLHPGALTLDFDHHEELLFGAAVQRDGRIVVGGSGGSPGADDGTVLARIVGDATPPTRAAVKPMPRYTTNLSRAVSWHATDANTGVKKYDVARGVTRYDQATGSLAAWKTGILATHASLQGKPGRTYCFTASAFDWAGNQGGYGSFECVTTPVDDRTPTAHGTWSKGTGSAYYRSTFRASTDGGASLTLPVAYRHLALLVDTCAACGKVTVKIGKTTLGTFNLKSAKTHHKVLVTVDARSNIRKGTLRLIQASDGKKVVIDGIGVDTV